MFGSSRKSKRVRLLKLKLWSLKFKLNEFESLQTSVNTELHGATVCFTVHIFYHTLFLRRQSVTVVTVTVVTVIGAKVTKGSSSWQKEEGSVKASRPHKGE